MIEIITSSGISLDLSPEAEFEIEFENPIMNSERIPVPYSTSIDFLPTPENCDVFGWFPGLPARPNVTKINASIYIDGLPFLSGILEFEGIEEGRVQYSFSCADIAGAMELKDIADYAPLKEVDEEVFDDLLKTNTYSDHVQFPVIVNSAYSAKCLGEGVATRDKYHNFQHSNAFPYVIPAFRIHRILSNLFEGKINMDDLLSSGESGEFALASILGPYKTDITHRGYGLVKKDNLFKLGITLPKINGADFIKNVCNMFCAAIFRTRSGYTMKLIRDIITADSLLVEDWGDKVSDDFSLSVEEGQAYVFGYGNDDDECSLAAGTLDELIEEGKIAQAITTENMFMKYSQEGGYTTVCIDSGYLGSKDARYVYSVKWCKEHGEFLIDCVYRPLEKIDTSTTENSDSYDASVDFALAKCIPLRLQGSAIPSLENVLCLSSVMLELPGVGTERGSDAYVLLTRRYVDYFGSVGDFIASDDGRFYSFTADMDISEVCGYSADLLPGSMYRKYHENYSDWLARPRVIVTADLRLTNADLLEFKMYKKVYFRGKNWLVSKLSVSLNVKSGIVSSSGEFIEC